MPKFSIDARFPRRQWLQDRARHFILVAMLRSVPRLHDRH
jgi:hypothetical protein